MRAMEGILTQDRKICGPRQNGTPPPSVCHYRQRYVHYSPQATAGASAEPLQLKPLSSARETDPAGTRIAHALGGA
jgi:hypothetical protein